MLIEDCEEAEIEDLEMFCSCSTQVQNHLENFYRDAEGADIVVMTVTLSIVGFLGIFGNVVVIIACIIFSSSEHNTQHYLLSIAVVDFIICLVLIPYRIAAYHVIIPEIACKIFEGLTYFTESLSLGLLLAVALDRYLAVCHPVYFANMKYFPRVWACITAAVMLTVGIPAGLLAGDYEFVSINATNSSGLVCYTGVCDANGLDLRYSDSKGLSIYVYYLTVLYLVAVCSFIVLYARVFQTVYRKFAHKTTPVRLTNLTKVRGPQRRSCFRRPRQPSLNSAETMDEGFKRTSASQRGADAQDPSFTHDLHCGNLNQNCLKSVCTKKEGWSCALGNGNERISKVQMHQRIAISCLMVTVAYIVTWVPFFLIRLGFVPNIITLRLAFFWSNMINPFIYSFANRKFRENILSLLNSLRNAQ